MKRFRFTSAALFATLGPGSHPISVNYMPYVVRIVNAHEKICPESYSQDGVSEEKEGLG